MTKKNQKIKTKESRLSEIKTIKAKLLEIGLDERFQEIAGLIRIMNFFVETGESHSGKIPLSNSNKDIYYILSNRQHIHCKVNIVVRNN